MVSEIIEGEIVDEHVSDLVPIAHSRELSVRPEVSAQDLVQRLAVIKEAMETAMVRDTDYGVIPGTGKPALLKPGAEKLSVLFQLDVQLENEKQFDGPHLTVSSKATVYHAPSGTRLGFGEGLCSTREKKYAYRDAQRLCPECGQPQVRLGKARDSKPGNWYCWRKQGGCGATWALDSEQAKLFEKMEAGQVDNPDLPDLWNTVVKMAEKRARVDAVLAVTGASALFTQDAEEAPAETAQAVKPPEPDPKAEARKAASRLQRMRVKIEKLAQDADVIRKMQLLERGDDSYAPGTTWGEVLRVIAWREEEALQSKMELGHFGSDWESLTEQGLVWLGQELKAFIDSGCSMGNFYDAVTVPF